MPKLAMTKEELVLLRRILGNVETVLVLEKFKNPQTQPGESVPVQPPEKPTPLNEAPFEKVVELVEQLTNWTAPNNDSEHKALRLVHTGRFWLLDGRLAMKCPECGKLKPLSWSGWLPMVDYDGRPGGLHLYCRECLKERGKKYNRGNRTRNLSNRSSKKRVERNKRAIAKNQQKSGAISHHQKTGV